MRYRIAARHIDPLLPETRAEEGPFDRQQGERDLSEFFSTDILNADILNAFLQVVLIDLVLAGDNAIVIGLAAAGLPQAQRSKAILIGIVAATMLRVLFAGLATQILQIGPSARGRNSVVVGVLENVARAARLFCRAGQSEGGCWRKRWNKYRRQAPQNTRPSELADCRC
jgi:hypothetical protein